MHHVGPTLKCRELKQKKQRDADIVEVAKPWGSPLWKGVENVDRAWVAACQVAVPRRAVGVQRRPQRRAIGQGRFPHGVLGSS